MPERPAPPAAARFGVTSMVAPLRRVLLRRPATAGDFAGADWRPPDPGLGCDVEVAAAADGLVDATYVRDPGLMTGRGAVLFQMAKPARRLEPRLLGAALESAGVPITGRLDGTARADGGDFIWLDDDTLLAGRSYRTNAEALRQLREILAAEGVRVESVDLPHDRGPDHVLHLMSVISPVAGDLAVVYQPLAPVALMQELAARGVAIHTQLVVPSLEGVSRAVEAGLGIAILSWLVVERAVTEGRLHIVEVRDIDLRRTFKIVSLKDRTLSPITTEFVKFLQESAVLEFRRRVRRPRPAGAA